MTDITPCREDVLQLRPCNVAEERGPFDPSSESAGFRIETPAIVLRALSCG